MRYSYYDLKEQEEDTPVVVRLSGSSANVILLDQANFANYRAGRPFLYQGGFHRRSPVRLRVPRDGHWYVVVDLGGYKGKVRALFHVVDHEVPEAHGDARAESPHGPGDKARQRELAQR